MIERNARSHERPHWPTSEGVDPVPFAIPRPTPWPAILAFSSMFLLWGVVTSWLITAAGLVGFATAIGGWIREMRHESDA